MEKAIPIIMITAVFVSVLLLSGCDEKAECSMGIDCRFFECPLNCISENYCSEGQCECRCTGQTAECENSAECSNNCGIPPNEAVCEKGSCTCKFECEHAVDCGSFECLLDCRPNYNFCDEGACSCACEQGAQNYSLWQVNELKEELKGKIIEVKGIAKIGETECTETACTDEDPCCRTCTAGLYLSESIDGTESEIPISGLYESKEIGCTGNNCSISCGLMEEGDKYSVRGIWKEEKGVHFLEPLEVNLLEKSIPKISSDKTEYTQSETVEFSIEYGKEISRNAWDAPKIQKKEGGQWIEYGTDCGCTIDCLQKEEKCEDNLSDCIIADGCEKTEKEKAFSWTQEYCELEEIECTWSIAGITEPVYCGRMKTAEPGTYKLVFYYVEACGGEKATIYSNEFSVN